jgi:Zn-dependent M28 family amino/carboxypeptidase
VIRHGVGAGLPDASDPIVIAAFVGFVFIPFLISLYFMVDYKTIVDGANDNLSGCYIGIALLKYLQDNGITFEHTEIGVLNTGSEEAGTRGAKAFAKQHKGEYDDVTTVVYSFDTIHDPKELMVNYRDLNGMFKTDKAANDLFYESAKELDIPCKKGWVPPLGGSTDAIALHRGGIRSSGVTGLSHKLEDYYHTRKDSYDNLNLEGLANCFAVTAKVLEQFDEGKLDE